MTHAWHGVSTFEIWVRHYRNPVWYGGYTEPRRTGGALRRKTLQLHKFGAFTVTDSVEFMECIYAPAFADWTTLVRIGNHGAETQFCLPIINIARVRVSTVMVPCTRVVLGSEQAATKIGWVQMVSNCRLISQPQGHAPRRGVDVPLCACQCASDRNMYV